MNKNIYRKINITLVMLMLIAYMTFVFSSCSPSQSTDMRFQEDYMDGQYTLFFAYNGDGTCTVYDAEGTLPPTFCVPESTSNGWRVSVLGEGCFSWNCREVVNVVIPDTVVSIEGLAFNMGEKIEYVTIGKNVQSLHSSAFASSEKLKSIITLENSYFVSVESKCLLDSAQESLLIGTVSGFIPESIKKVENYSFSNRIFENELIIPESVKAIGDYAFEGSQNIGNLILPNSIELLGKGCFRDTDMVSICGGSYLTVEEDLFAYCENLELVHLPESVTKICRGAFYIPETKLVSLHVPRNVLEIEKYAIYCPNTIVCFERNEAPSEWDMSDIVKNNIVVWGCREH